jgi:hypothetical protein
MGCPRNPNKQTAVDDHDNDSDRRDGAMVDSFVFQIDWTTVALVIGVLLSLGAVLLYGGRGRG